MLYPIELWVQPLITKHLRCELVSQHDNLILSFDTGGRKGKNSAPHAAKVWQKTQFSNLIRYVPSGKYFARLRVHGKLILKERFRGTVYRAANSQWVGVTAGRSRQDRHTCLQVPRKDIYLYPPRRSFRQALCG